MRSAAARGKAPADKAAAPAPSTNGSNGRASAAPANALPTAGTTAPAEVKAPSPAEGRDGGGRFAKGNKGGPGNPFARQVAARRKALLDAISLEDVGRVAQELRDRALAGDVAAAKVLLAYVVGTPAPVADPDRLDLDELALALAQPLQAQLVLHGIAGVDPAAALAFLRHMAACHEQSPRSILEGCKGIDGAMQLASLRKKAVEARAKVT